MPHQRAKTAMSSETITALVEILADPKGAANALPPEDQQTYEDAKRSVVEARFQTEPAEGQIRIL